jgi:multiple sugar transport system permease protein
MPSAPSQPYKAPIEALSMARARPKRRRGNLQQREAMTGILMALPWILGFLLFTAGPMIFGLYTGLTRWDMITPPRWVGLENFIRMFSGKDRLFYRSLGVTFRYVAMSAPLHVVLGFILAALLNMKMKGSNLFRSIYYLPSVLPIVASSVMWSWVFNPDYGLFNQALSALGIQGPMWLSSSQWALPSIVIMNLHYIGPGMIILLAGLQRVPQELYEASQLDGANALQTLRHITLPLMSPVIFFVIITHINGSFQTFTQAFLLTNGGPNYATYFYMLHRYNEAWGAFRMGYASALAWVLFLVIVGFLLIHFRLGKAWVYSESDD